MTDLRRIVRLVRIGFLAVGGLLLFLLLVDLLWVYQVLYNSSVVLANLYAFSLLVLIGALVGYLMFSRYRHPAVLLPPPKLEPENARALARRLKYSHRFAKRLAQNSHLEPQHREQLQDRLGSIESVLRSGSSCEQLLSVQLAAEACIDKALQPCDELAKRRVRNATRDVMLTVALSPWRAIDLIFVLVRSMRMIHEITLIYNSRPRLKEQLLIYRDVFFILATVNFLNMGNRLMQNLTGSLPFLGRFADDIAQGFGAGLMTSIAGHSAISRCRIFGGWSDESVHQVSGQGLASFAKDVKKMLLDDLVPEIMRPLSAQSPVADQVGEIQVRSGVSAAIENTFGLVDSFVLKPVKAAGQGTAGAGRNVGNAVWQTSKKAAGEIYAAAEKTVSSTKNSLGSWLRRVRGR